eukprot:5471763-Alexandrium_andersonii.AAC.1
MLRVLFLRWLVPHAPILDPQMEGQPWALKGCLPVRSAHRGNREQPDHQASQSIASSASGAADAWTGD